MNEQCALIGDVIHCRCGKPSSHYGTMGERGARVVREVLPSKDESRITLLIDAADDCIEYANVLLEQAPNMGRSKEQSYRRCASETEARAKELREWADELRASQDETSGKHWPSCMVNTGGSCCCAQNYDPERTALIWRRIETAPKSETVIGAWKDGKWVAKEMWFDDSVDEWTDTCSDRYLKPTHWAPSPEKTSVPIPAEKQCVCFGMPGCQICGGTGVKP